MSRFFIDRPIVAIVIAILTVIVGAVVIVGLPVAQFPAIAPPEIQIYATYVGADPQTIEQSVATPIEQQMSGVDNMNYMSSLKGDVATAYLTLRELDDVLEISARTLRTREESLELTRSRQQGGVATLLDLRQSEQLVDTAAQAIPGIGPASGQTENQIRLLLGESPGQVPRGRRLVDQGLAPEVPAGLPSELLQRRPDIRAAEQDLVAANAEIGVAKAAYFPQVSLSGFLGGQSTQLASLFSGPHGVWNLTPQLTPAIFTAGGLKSNVKLAEAEREQALVQYEKTIQTAFAEVSN